MDEMQQNSAEISNLRIRHFDIFIAVTEGGVFFSMKSSSSVSIRPE